MDGAPGTYLRKSIMEDLSQHNPSVCLQPDDLEALNSIYPACEDAVQEVVCNKANLHLGAMRICMFVSLCFVFALAIACGCHLFSWCFFSKYVVHKCYKVIS